MQPPTVVQAITWFVSLGFSPIWVSFGNHLWFIGFLFAFALLSLCRFSSGSSVSEARA